MFVNIENFKSPLAVENILTPYKRGRLAPDKKSYLPKEPITPDICWEVLHSTNAPRNIKDMLICIADLPPSEQAQFKDVVLSTFSNREQPEAILQLGQKLAEDSGYEKELAEARELMQGDALLSKSYLARCWITKKNSFPRLNFTGYEKLICLSNKELAFKPQTIFPKIMEFPFASKVSLKSCDFTCVQSIRFKDGAIVNLNGAKNLPAQLDVSRCADVDLSQCNLRTVQSIRFKDGAKVNLWGAKNLPSQLDVSMCADVAFHWCDLAPLTNLSFKNDAIVDLCGAQNLPPHLDFSYCSNVNLNGCDLSNQPHLSFKDGAVVSLFEAQNLPPQLDVSMCSDINLNSCNLAPLTNLSFKNDAVVSLWGAYNLPPYLDVSKCAEIDFLICDFQNVERIVFKNREQMEKSQAKFSDNWKGTLVFADEQPQKNLNFSLTTKNKGGR